MTFFCLFLCRILKCLWYHLIPTLLLKEIYIGSDSLTVLAHQCISALENLPFQHFIHVTVRIGTLLNTVFFLFNTFLIQTIFYFLMCSIYYGLAYLLPPQISKLKPLLQSVVIVTFYHSLPEIFLSN